MDGFYIRLLYSTVTVYLAAQLRKDHVIRR
jgi:hypothetical protein